MPQPDHAPCPKQTTPHTHAPNRPCPHAEHSTLVSLDDQSLVRRPLPCGAGLSIPVVPKLFTVPYPFRHLISNSDWNCLQIPSSKYNRNLRIIIISRLKKQTCTALIMF